VPDVVVGVLSDHDTGRFHRPTSAEAPVERVADLDTGRFRSAAPQPVLVDSLPDIERAAVAVPDVSVAPVPDLERHAAPAVGDVLAPVPSGLFHSDFMRAPEGVDAPLLDAVEPSPSTPRPKPTPRNVTSGKDAKGRSRRREPELDKILCRCGETHRLSRCPACGTARLE
jgi:hypothetical protein